MGGKTSYASIKKYEDKAYDKILLRVPKGHREVIERYAKAKGESSAHYIRQAITERMERDDQE